MTKPAAFIPTVEEVLQNVSYDPETGEFIRVKATPGHAAGVPAGTTDSKGYRIITIAKRRYKAHRLAWLIVTGFWPPSLVDHRDGNPGNNRFLNLRAAGYEVNNANLKVVRSGVGYLNVYKKRGKFLVKFRRAGKLFHAGPFPTPEAARDEAERMRNELDNV